MAVVVVPRRPDGPGAQDVERRRQLIQALTTEYFTLQTVRTATIVDSNSRAACTRAPCLARSSPKTACLAHGRSNAGIANELGLSERTVEAATAQLFRKLDLEPSPDLNRRVLAVLALLRSR